MTAKGTGPRRGSVLGATALLALASTLVIASPSAAQGIDDPTYVENGDTAAPLMGWSSWSLQATSASGVNPQGNYSYLTEENVLAQADVMAAELLEYGYEYINLDAGWWREWDWTPLYDDYGRYEVFDERFPNGIEYVIDYIHDLGLKVGIYVPVGLEKGAYDEGDYPIEGSTTGCTTHDVVYSDLRTTNGWNSSYAMDFSNPCAQEYIDSLARQYAEWGIDFLKIDGVGYGSNRTTAMETVAGQYDNRDDLAAWNTAFDNAGTDVTIQISWSIDQDYIEDWQQVADSWRISFDIECYCDTLTQWSGTSWGGSVVGVKSRFQYAADWQDSAGWEVGWNDFDSLNVGNGAMDGLTEDERRTTYTLWAIGASPLYLGDDLTQLDDFGLELITNEEVIAVNQSGVPAGPIGSGSDPQQVWTAQIGDSYVVALFNIADTAATVSTDFAADLGIEGGTVRDLWAQEDLGSATSFSADLAAHATRLLLVTPTDAGDETGAAELPATGVDPAAGVGGAAVLVLAGLVVVLRSRRRLLNR